jgi:hypothetical protein
LKNPSKKILGALPDAKSKAFYEDAILEMLLHETNHQIKDPLALLIYLTETYHPVFQKKQRGKPTRWTPLLKAVLAVEIDNLRDAGVKSRKEAAKVLAVHPIWEKMKPSYNAKSASAGAEQFEAVDKLIRRTEKTAYLSAQRIYQKYLKDSNLNGWYAFISFQINLPQRLGDKPKP